MAETDPARSKQGKKLLKTILADGQLTKQAAIWNPNIHVRNTLGGSSQEKESWFSVFESSSVMVDGQEQENVIVCHNLRFRCKFMERFELERFPCDTQVHESHSPSPQPEFHPSTNPERFACDIQVLSP